MEKEVIWSVHPARKNKRKFYLFLLSLLISTVLLYFAGGVFWTVFGLIVLLLALYPFYVKTEYRASSHGILIKRPFYTKKRKWSEFRRIREYENGILLSPYLKNTFLENFRGEFLLVEPEDRGKVMKILKELLDEYGGKDKGSEREN